MADAASSWANVPTMSGQVPLTPGPFAVIDWARSLADKVDLPSPKSGAGDGPSWDAFRESIIKSP